MNNKKVLVIGVVIGFILGSALTVFANISIQAILNEQVKVFLNGEIKTFVDETTGEKQYPITYNNRTYLPLRNIANLVGLEIDYDANTNSILLGKNENKVEEKEVQTYSKYLSGTEFNNAVKELVGDDSSSNNDGVMLDQKIVSIQMATNKPSDDIIKKAKNVGVNIDGYLPIYAWNDNYTIKIWSDANVISLNEDASKMFKDFSELKSISLKDVLGSNIDTSNVTNMYKMFDNCFRLEQIDLSGINTSNVTNMGSMFQSCPNLKELNLKDFDTHKVETMSNMFNNDNNLTTLDISSFDTSNVKYMSAMFSGLKKLTTIDVSHFDTKNVVSMMALFNNCQNITKLDISNFDTSNVESFSDMFYGCLKLSDLDLSSFNTKKATTMSDMFTFCWGLKTLDLSSFDTHNVIYFHNMFNSCSNLEKIYVSDSFVITNKVKNSTDMFNNCEKLVGGKGTKFNINFADKTLARIDGGETIPGYFSEKSR